MVCLEPMLRHLQREILTDDLSGTSVKPMLRPLRKEFVTDELPGTYVKTFAERASS